MQNKIGLDLGASRVKGSIYDQAGAVKNFNISNRVNVDDSIGSSGYIVEYNNHTKRVGASSGIPNMQPLKLRYSHLEEIILAVGYEMKQILGIKEADITINIETLLPPKQFFSNGKDFKKRIADIGTINGLVNGQAITVNIETVNVNCEGVALLKTLDFNTLSANVKRVLLIDVGSSTIDLVEVIKEDDIWKIGKVDTIEFGGTRMCKAIEKSLANKYKSQFPYDVLEKEMSYTFEGKVFSILDEAECLNSIVEEFVVQLNQFADHRQYKVILAGDGSELLYSNKKMKEFIPTAHLLDANVRLYGNSIGALMS